MLSLEVHCSHEERGCGWTGHLYELEVNIEDKWQKNIEETDVGPFSWSVVQNRPEAYVESH